jgi:uncharacterized membrane protein YczE
MEFIMKKLNLTKIIGALIGILFIGIGVAWNAANGLGNDPIGLVYDGMRNTLSLTSGQLGMVSNIINLTLITLLFIIGRRYVNLGTVIYILPYGLSVSLGSRLYDALHVISPAGHILAALAGCLFIYLGVALYIAVDIGLDPFTGIVMVIRDKLKLDFKKVKIGFDITMIILGTLLGGSLGIVTILTALTAGPCIQWLASTMNTLLLNRDSRSPQKNGDKDPQEYCGEC